MYCPIFDTGCITLCWIPGVLPYVWHWMYYPILILDVLCFNSPNSAPHSGHVTFALGWTLRDKCSDNFPCFSVAMVRPGLPLTAIDCHLVLSKHSLDCMHVHPALDHVTNSVWCPPLPDRITSIDTGGWPDTAYLSFFQTQNAQTISLMDALYLILGAAHYSDSWCLVYMWCRMWCFILKVDIPPISETEWPGHLGLCNLTLAP